MNEIKGINSFAYGLLKVSGVEAKKLLQGQLTCDVEKAAASDYILGAHCNPQGRIISFFRLFLGHDAYYLLMPQEMVAIALTALKKYAIFYKVALTELNSSALDIAEITGLNAIAWRQHDMQQYLPVIYASTSGKFLPHELHLPELAAVSFDKGCYTGQEIIARMHYRGKLKNHLYHAAITTTQPPFPGDEIYNQQHGPLKASGTVVDVYELGENKYHILLVANAAEIGQLLVLNDQTTLIDVVSL
jgi:hypothetical protein